MVRINIIIPRNLADQHLIAEYNEMLMLIGYVRRYPKIKSAGDIPKEYCLGKGHIKFFKNKLLYIKKRHELIKKEMKRRGFRTEKTINLKGFPKNLINDWKPGKKDKELIKARIIWKLKKKPCYYKYRGEHELLKFLIGLIKKG